jgi:hypothetical protein
MSQYVLANPAQKGALDKLQDSTDARGPGGVNSKSNVPFGVPLKTTLVDNYAAPFNAGRDHKREVHYDEFTLSAQVVHAAYEGIPFASFDTDPVRGERDAHGYPKPRSPADIRRCLKTLEDRLDILNTPQVPIPVP